MDSNIKTLLIVIIGFFVIFWISQNFSLVSFRNTGNTSIGIIVVVILFVFLNRKK